MGFIQVAAALVAFSVAWVALAVVPMATVVGIPWAVLAPTTTLAGITTNLLLLGPALLAAIWLLHRLTPVAWRFRRLGAVRLSAREPFAQEVRRLARRRGMRPPAVYRVPLDGIQAFAASGFGNAVAFYAGAMELPAPHREWLIGHELAHLRYRDTRAGLWWVAASWALGAAERLAVAALDLGARVPLIGWLLALYLRLVRWAVGLAWGIFMAVDRQVGRLMEYRADRQGALDSSPKAGIELLHALPEGVEPGLGLFATHPPTRRRIRNLEAYQP